MWSPLRDQLPTRSPDKAPLPGVSAGFRAFCVIPLHRPRRQTSFKAHHHRKSNMNGFVKELANTSTGNMFCWQRENPVAS